MRRLAAVLALGLVAAACGGDDTGLRVASSSTTTSTTATPTTATTTTTTTIAQGDGIVAEAGDFVAVHYIGTLDDGTEFDASRPRGSTLDFTIGTGAMIAGFDQGVRGMAIGETRIVRIEPADAYGEFDPEALVEFDISEVPEGVVVGQVLQTASGQVTVVSVVGDVVTIDFNHELAGEALTFEIEMVAINP